VRFLIAFLGSAPCRAGLHQRGYLETRSFFFPQTGSGRQRAYTGEAMLRWESGWQLRKNLRLNAGLDGRFDSHRQFERERRLDSPTAAFSAPPLSVRRLSLLWNHSGWTLEAGRQFIRWGKADLLNPTTASLRATSSTSSTPNSSASPPCAPPTNAAPTRSTSLRVPVFTPIAFAAVEPALGGSARGRPRFAG
jgi:hypothetical protein